jgi:hypothetical protein
MMTGVGPIAWRRILPPVGLLVVLLAVLSPQYGYERDELYFRMLAPAWGFVDQPPLTPLLAHGIAALSDTVWAIRIPAILLAGASVVVLALVAREAGGGPRAQGYAAWGAAFGTFTLVFGHSFLTGTIDLLAWPVVLLGAIRGVMRSDGRWWLLSGAAAGVDLSNKLLVAMLLAGIAVGLAVAGPRRELRSPWLWAGVALALLLGLPDLVYQVAGGFPQLRMGAALAARHGDVRLLTVPYLALLLSPLLVPVWVAGLVALLRRPAWRRIRFVAVAFLVVVVLAVLAGGQPYYPYGALTVVFALGCVPTAEWADRRGRRALVAAVLGTSAAVTSVIALPLVPLPVLGRTPIPTIDVATADQVGWPQLAATVDTAGAAVPDAVVLTTNYGEAGAIARYSTRFATRVYSGHNALGELPVPDVQPAAVIVVGRQLPVLAPRFASCREVARLDDGSGVDNEEQGAPVALCTGSPRLPALVAAARHLD